MRIVFSRHASAKIFQRKIPRQVIVATIAAPDFSKTTRSCREELYRKLGKNYLKVIIKREWDRIVVITAHVVAKVKNK